MTFRSRDVTVSKPFKCKRRCDYIAFSSNSACWKKHVFGTFLTTAAGMVSESTLKIKVFSQTQHLYCGPTSQKFFLNHRDILFCSCLVMLSYILPHFYWIYLCTTKPRDWIQNHLSPNSQIKTLIIGLKFLFLGPWKRPEDTTKMLW